MCERDIIIIMDNSGSMEELGDEPLESLKMFVEKQQSDNNKGKLSLWFFNNYINNIIDDICISDIDLNKIKFKPTGMTCLYDAIIIAVTKKLKNNENKKDVSVVIITDGLENSSQKYNKKDVEKIISKTEKKLNWNYIYIGANQDSYKVGGSIGIKNCSNFNSTSSGSLSKIVRLTSDNITIPLKKLSLKRMHNSI